MRDINAPHYALADKLADDLYVEAMVLADEARCYLEAAGPDERSLLDPQAQVIFSCEALKITTRLMQVIAWLLGRRALARGEIDRAEANSERYRLGDAAATDQEQVRSFPSDMRMLIVATESLHKRAQRLEDRLTGAGGNDDPLQTGSPARELMHRLETIF